MSHCVEKGIAPSKFRSWPEQDQDEIVAYLAWQKGLCPGCGVHHTEQHQYSPTLKRCSVCEQVEQIRATIPTDANGHGVSVVLERIGT
jgi:hypothetical protein